MVDFERLSNAYRRARQELFDRRTSSGHWEGKLANSALSTATAVSALALVRRQLGHDDSPASLTRQEELGKLIFAGMRWLVAAQNPDGGWGDTDRSRSNIATTMLVRAAFHLTCLPADHGDMLARAERFIDTQGGIAGLRRRYGRDKTFAVPILTNCALAGLVPWHEVSPLPFELACFPQSWFRFLQLPVVSYAIPALVAIGQARYFHRPPWNPLVRWWRGAAVDPSLRVLEQMQPVSGGFLEATPLTSFVVMSLAAIGQAQHPVVRRGLDFLISSVREDGAWPIDTNLATWVTTLSLNALAGDDDRAAVDAAERSAEWLLDCQCRDVHPYTGAAPGGWGWSDLSGSVPDADDTSGALLTLASLVGARQRHGLDGDAKPVEAAARGVAWLLDLQNSDGGWPTFCRGWGKLPFDRSGTDLTAHAIRALATWRQTNAGVERAISSGFDYLARVQRPNGSWVPLWFGDEADPNEENPIYGTARVLLAYSELGRSGEQAARRGAAWLASVQRNDGGWGSHAGVEQTALAIEALMTMDIDAADDFHQPIERGLAWLVDAVETGRFRESSPIGLYFARLWYYEALYPVIFTVATLGRAIRRFEPAPLGRRLDRAPRPPDPMPARPMFVESSPAP
ncbi:MAG TPA: prenyltransferase/squalene oxidase repeat-containing protein [Pirellulales bacterium]|nr:prenyltransferase/squalene oxidase repeat-containing protein [Pirellulales bacterium]